MDGFGRSGREKVKEERWADRSGLGEKRLIRINKYLLLQKEGQITNTVSQSIFIFSCPSRIPNCFTATGNLNPVVPW